MDCSQWGDLESGEEELAEEEEQQPALTDGMQTPSGLEMPSGMGSVVSSIVAGLKVPDFLAGTVGSGQHAKFALPGCSRAPDISAQAQVWV